MNTPKHIPAELVDKCNEAITALEKLREKMSERRQSIIKQRDYLESQLKELSNSKVNVKINLDEKKAFENDCNQYLQTLQNIVGEIDGKITSREKVIETKLPEKEEEVISLLIFIHQSSIGTKKFIKKMEKYIAVVHSRFSFRFEIQQKHLNYMLPIKK